MHLLYVGAEVVRKDGLQTTPFMRFPANTALVMGQTPEKISSNSLSEQPVHQWLLFLCPSENSASPEKRPILLVHFYCFRFFFHDHGVTKKHV